MVSKKLILAGALVVASATTALPAGASPARPEPDCGVAITDKAGDNVNATTNQQGTPNTDLTQAFFRYTTEAGKPRVTFNMRIADLNKTIQDPYLAHQYLVDVTVNKAPKVLGAIVDRTGMIGGYYGTQREVTDTDPLVSYEGDTPAAFHEGKDGVIEIDVPIDAWKAHGATFGAPSIEIRQAMRTHRSFAVPGLVYLAPIVDTGTGKGGFVASPCAAPGVPTVAGPVNPATHVSGGLTDEIDDTPTLGLKVSTPRLTVKGIRKARGFRVTLSGKATRLKGQLKRGSKVLATGRLARLAGKGTMRFKMRKALRKGVYSIVFTGTNAAGKTASVGVSVKVR